MWGQEKLNLITVGLQHNVVSHASHLITDITDFRETVVKILPRYTTKHNVRKFGEKRLNFDTEKFKWLRLIIFSYQELLEKLRKTPLWDFEKNYIHFLEQKSVIKYHL